MPGASWARYEVPAVSVGLFAFVVCFARYTLSWVKWEIRASPAGVCVVATFRLIKWSRVRDPSPSAAKRQQNKATA